MREEMSLYWLEDAAMSIKSIGNLMESMAGNRELHPEAREEAGLYLNKLITKETDRILLIMRSNLKNNLK